MTPQVERTSGYHKMVRPRTVTVVTGDAGHHVIEAVLGAMDHDIVVVQSTANAYSHIKRTRPDLVVVCLAGDDSEGCQLLTMLTLDRETSRIPVITHVIPAEDADADTDWAHLADEGVGLAARFALN